MSARRARLSRSQHVSPCTCFVGQSCSDDGQSTNLKNILLHSDTFCGYNVTVCPKITLRELTVLSPSSMMPGLRLSTSSVVLDGREVVNRLGSLQMPLAQRTDDVRVAPLVNTGLVEHVETGKHAQLVAFLVSTGEQQQGHDGEAYSATEGKREGNMKETDEVDVSMVKQHNIRSVWHTSQTSQGVAVVRRRRVQGGRQDYRLLRNTHHTGV